MKYIWCDVESRELGTVRYIVDVGRHGLMCHWTCSPTMALTFPSIRAAHDYLRDWNVGVRAQTAYVVPADR